MWEALDIKNKKAGQNAPNTEKKPRTIYVGVIEF